MKHCRLAIILIALALLAGCTGAATTEEPASQQGKEVKSWAGEGESINQSVEEVASANVQQELIKVGITADVTDWSPWVSGGAGRNAALYSIYQCLADFDQGDLIPVLLKSWETSEDGLSIECVLYDDIYDSEGNPFTSDDAIWNYEMASSTYSSFVERINHIDKTSDTQFVIYLNRKMNVGELKDMFAYFVCTQESYEASKDGMKTQPVGTGPYVLDSQTGGYSFTYVKNDNYWATEDVINQSRDMQNVDRIEWYVISEASQLTIALQQHTIDMCGSVSAEDLDKFDGKNGYQLFTGADNLSMVMFPNCDSSSPCSDVNLRLAICNAVSGQAVLDSVYSGDGTVMYSQAPTWAKGYNEEWKDTYYDYDPEKAAEYLEQSDYQDQTLKIICQTGAQYTNTAQIINSFLSAIGINSQIVTYESSVYNEYIQDPAQWDIMVTTRPTSTGYFVQTIFSDFHKSRYSYSQTINFISDDTLQELLGAALPEDTYSQETVDALEQYIVANGYSKGLCNYSDYYVVPDRVSAICLSMRKTLIPGGCTYTE